MAAKDALQLAPEAGNPLEYEQSYVHKVYDTIADHFSATRYKPWPVIAGFLESIPTGSIGLDSGCGNGKYLSLPSNRNSSLCTIGLDRSFNLLKIARKAGGVERDAVQGDALDLPWREGIFDYAISIATIHHLSTPERRRAAVQAILTSIRPEGGRALIYVWAVEQDHLSKRVVPQGTKSSVDSGVDVFVPWVMTHNPNNHQGQQPQVQPPVYQRYYHLFGKGELVILVREACDALGFVVGLPDYSRSGVPCGVEILQDGWERSNYYVELRRWTI